MSHCNSEENLNLIGDDTDDAIVNEDNEKRFSDCVLHHGQEVFCHCHCVGCCESYEEVKPLPARLAPVYCCFHDSPELAAFACECGDDEHSHNHVDCHNQNHVEEQIPHCRDCEEQELPSDEDERRSPIPESLHSDYNSRTPSPVPIELDENNGQGNSIPQPPIPPPLPQVSSGNSRMTAMSTTMTPMTLLKVLSSAEGGPFDIRLHEAAKDGDAEKLYELLKDQSMCEAINSKINPFMSTPLREAVAGGNVECIRALLSNGAEVDAVDIKGQTALFFAASSGLYEIMEELLKHGANPEGSRYNNSTPLLLCVRDGCTEGVQILLKYGVNPEPVSMLTTCAPGWPLQHSVVYRHYGCFLALLKGGAETSYVQVIRSKMASDKNNHEQIDSGMTHRLSITRTAMRHAREHAEFLLTFREFGGSFEPLENLPANMKSEDCPALSSLKYCLDNPLSLKSQCRLKLCRTVGAKKLNSLATSTLLPGSLVEYLNFNDCLLPTLD